MGEGDVRGKPLQIPWDQMFHSCDIPPPDLQIYCSSSVAGGSTAGSQQQEPEEVEERSPIEDCFDQDVQEISRNIFDTNSVSGLPDKGVKFPACISVSDQVRNRREKPAKEYADEEVSVTRSQFGFLSGLQQNHQASSSTDRSHANHQCTFSSLFNQKLDTEADNNSSLAFTMELRVLRRKTKRLAQADPQKHKSEWQARSPWKSLPFRFHGSITRDNKQSSSAGCDSKHSTFLSSIFRKKSVTASDGQMSNLPTETCPFTDSKGLQDHTSTSMDSNEVEEVVVLDEEDSEDELQLIQPREADFDNQKETIIYYPSRDHPECIEICYSDITCLNARAYLSSTIMNFYIQYLRKSSSLIGVRRGEYHFFNTYFYTKLEEAVSTNVDKKMSFAKLRRWLKGVNIFEKAYIFLPIHGNT